jgi:hypothetical protein
MIVWHVEGGRPMRRRHDNSKSSPGIKSSALLYFDNGDTDTLSLAGQSLPERCLQDGDQPVSLFTYGQR